MRLQKFTHACLLVETGSARLLFDPGVFSSGYEGLEGLTGILITHQHMDHFDPSKLPALLQRNPEARIVADAETADLLSTEHGLSAVIAKPGESIELGCDIVFGGGEHAVIHPDIPNIANVGYLIDGTFWHPGDSLVMPPGEVDVLALPTAAPWMKASEAIDFYRSVNPGVAVPIHEAVTSVPSLFYGMFENLGPKGSTVKVIDDGEPVQI